MTSLADTMNKMHHPHSNLNRVQTPLSRHSHPFVTWVALCFVALFVSNVSIAATSAEQTVYRSHGIAMHGDLKYPQDFKHFDYANPNAPKGGEIRLASTGGFDSLNPFVIKGNSAAGLNRLGQGLMYDSLTTQSNDEPFSQYGSLAKTIIWPEDRSWVTFELEPDARFHDGEPIRSDDVKWTFDTLVAKGHPLYQSYYGDVVEVLTPNELTVTFKFKNGENKELALIIGQLPVLPKHYWQDKDFNKADLTIPVGNGPYRIKSVDPGRSIVYERVKDWWAKDKAINKGQYNFDTIRYDYYRDESVAIEALKANQFDVRVESSSKEWATAYEGPQFEDGRMVKTLIEHDNPTGMQAFVYNTRRKPFDDIKVREALGYLFDFEWTNKTLFYNQYTRAKSYFNNSELGATGLPQGEELEILNKYRDQLPEEVFTKEFKVPTTDGSGNIRRNMRQALKLLKDAGWSLKQGKLLNKEGKPMKFEIMIVQPSFERVILPFQKNLKRIGVEVDIRKVDVQQFIKRFQSFDFDVMVGTFGQSSSPGNEQRGYWHSTQADNKGSRNTIGIKNPVIDDLIELIIKAPTRESLVARTRALDRVLLWNHYVIPQWHFPAYRVIYWNKFDFPKDAKTHYFSTDTWWSKSAGAKQTPSAASNQ